MSVVKLILTTTALFALAALPLSGSLAETDEQKEFKKARHLTSQGQHKDAFSIYLALAEKENNALAQFNTGLNYQNGWGRPEDPVSACQWFEKAAARSIPMAQQLSGDCFLQGIHTETPKPETAALWYERASNNGLLSATCLLGKLYLVGTGVDKDRDKGIALCIDAAQKGAITAQLVLADLFFDGKALEQDYVQARQWYLAAGDKGNPKAHYRLGLMFRDSLGTEQNLLEARRWFESAASKGFLAAYYPTAHLYFHASDVHPPGDQTTGGQWTEKELAKAYLWISASLVRETNLNQVNKLNSMLEEVKQVIPYTWYTALDKKVKNHLAGFDG